MSTEPANAHPRHQPGMVLTGVPHAEAISLMLVEVGAASALCRVPYDEKLIGNPETGVIHGGVITSLLDNACGIAVGVKTQLVSAIATLDLRIDYMKPATPKEDILAFADCYRVSRNIAFVRGLAYHTDRGDPIATCTAAFMLGTKSGRGANLAGKEGA